MGLWNWLFGKGKAAQTLGRNEQRGAMSDDASAREVASDEKNRQDMIHQFDFLGQEELSRCYGELCSLACAVQEAGISARFEEQDAPSIRAVCSEIRRLNEMGLGFRILRYEPGLKQERTLTETVQGAFQSSGQGGSGWYETYETTRTVVEIGSCSLQIVPSENSGPSTETSLGRE